MDPRDCHTDGSRSEREKEVSCINAYTQKLEKWFWWSFVLCRNRISEVRTTQMDTKMGKSVWEESGLTHTQWGPAVRHRELSLKEYTLCADLNGKEIQKKKTGDIWIWTGRTADSLSCTAENNATTLKEKLTMREITRSYSVLQTETTQLTWRDWWCALINAACFPTYFRYWISQLTTESTAHWCDRTNVP